jgi:hypothetical protein
MAWLSKMLSRRHSEKRALALFSLYAVSQVKLFLTTYTKPEL